MYIYIYIYTYNIHIYIYIYIYILERSARQRRALGPRAPTLGPKGPHGTPPWAQGPPRGWYPVPVRLVSGYLRAKSPDPRGDPSLKYIRSGPEGARGVLKGRGWSLCMFLSELPSFRLSAFCCPSVGLFVPLTGAAGGPGLTRADARFSTLFSHRFLDGFLKVLAPILEDFLNDVRMFFA